MNLDKFYGFRADNDKVIKQLAKDGGWKGPKYQVNQDEIFDLFPKDILDKI